MDIPCARCGEPYEAYGIFHGDMLSWEKDLFIAGAGCPSCEGESDADWQKAAENQALAVAIRGAWDRPEIFATVRAIGFETEFKHPEWIRPQNPVVWECCECTSQVCRNLDEKVELITNSGYAFMGHIEYASGLYWRGGRFAQLYTVDDEWDEILKLSIGDNGQPKKGVPADRKLDSNSDRGYCPGCAERCGGCGELNHNDDMMLPEGKFRKGDAVCRDCYDEIPRCADCDEEIEEGKTYCSDCKED